MDIYEQLKLLIENPNASPDARAAAQQLYDMLQKERDMNALASPPDAPQPREAS